MLRHSQCLMHCLSTEQTRAIFEFPGLGFRFSTLRVWSNTMLLSDLLKVDTATVLSLSSLVLRKTFHFSTLRVWTPCSSTCWKSIQQQCCRYQVSSSARLMVMRILYSSSWNPCKPMGCCSTPRNRTVGSGTTIVSKLRRTCMSFCWSPDESERWILTSKLW